MQSCSKLYISRSSRRALPQQRPLCVSRNNFDLGMLFPARSQTPYRLCLPQSRPFPTLFKRRIATMIHEQSSRKRPGGGHTHHRVLVVGVLNLSSDVLRRFIGHSCSTFIQDQRRGGSTASRDKLPRFVGRQYEVGFPSISSCSERFYRATPRKSSHGNFPPNTKTMVTPGTTRRSPFSLSHTQLNGTRAGGST